MEQKKRIAKYAFTLFRENGIRSISMAEIASDLGMSKRTLYDLFENKEDLLLYSLQQFQKERYQIIDKYIAETSSTIEAYLKVLDNNVNDNWNAKFFDDIEKYFHKVSKHMNDSRAVHIKLIESFILDGIKEGLFRPDLDIDVYTFLLVDLGESYVRALKSTSLPFSVKDLGYEMNLNAIRGISTSKGLEVIENYFSKKKELAKG